MPVRIATLLAACLLALAVPAAALGQGAGDDQYSDPFGDEQTEPSGGGDSGSSQGDDAPSDDHGPPPGGGDDGAAGGGTGSGGDAPVSSDDSGSAGTGSPGTAAPGAEAAGSSQAGELPYTGAEAGLLALGGALLLAGGVALRVRLRDQR